jgi:amino acid adenylation domain-containing protein
MDKWNDLIAIFEDKARQYPDNTALVFANDSLSYRELQERVAKVASYINQSKYSADKLIGVFLPRGIDLIVSVLGIIKSGAAVVPLDASYPIDRLNYMLEVSNLSLVISSKEMDAYSLNKSKVHFDDYAKIIKADIEKDRRESEISISPDDLFYVLFTSGSTGKPKGVALGHDAITNLVQFELKKSKSSSGFRSLMFSPISFDASFFDIFLALCSGSTLYVIGEEERLDSNKLFDYIETHEIQRLFLPYVALSLLAEVSKKREVGNLKLEEVISTAEQLSITESIKYFFKRLPGCTFENHYGPTESHVVSVYRMNEEDIDNWPVLPPIGKPIDHSEIFVLDPSMNPVKNGEEGELYLSGICLAKGYLNRPDLTKERFIKAPWNEDVLLYKTGDIGRQLADGHFEYLGRIDDQIKIRGFRIEPGEIESALSAIDHVKQAAVKAFQNAKGSKKLVAYLIADEEIAVDHIRKELAESLPDYMIPSVFLFLEEFPQTPSGKIARKELPDPLMKRPNLRNEYVAPKTDFQQMMAAIWCDLLEIDQVGTEDNFFDLGGSSVLSIQTVSELQSKGYELPIVKLYQYPSIKGIENYLLKENSNSLKDQLTKRKRQKSEMNRDVAIIGMSGRFPGANSTSEFWEMLCEGKEGITFFSDEELDSSIPSELRQHPDYVKAKGVTTDAQNFDAEFFGMSPVLAEIMDPQQRKFLEVAWEAFEDAGFNPEKYDGLVGVYAGCANNTYYLNNVLKRKDKTRLIGDFQAMVLNEKDYIATRTAFFMNLKGPAISLYTACSTSLTAITEAVNSLRDYQTDVAVAGAASINVPINSGYIYNEGGMLSKDGHCRPFDAQSTGTTFNDGVGAIVLKRLDDAIEDHDHIYAVIKGVGLSNDGSEKASFTAPSVEGQELALRMAQEDADVDTSQLGFVETHGTATPIGDPVEFEALQNAYSHIPNQACFLGSVKSNIGHLTPAAGVAGTIKTALALHHHKLPATINHTQANPEIDFENTSFKINTELLDWKTEDNQLLAAISSFGVGGTNAHIILQEYKSNRKSNKQDRKELFLLSAKTKEQLEHSKKRFINYCSTNPDADAQDVSYTLLHGRKHFGEAMFVAAQNMDELKEKLLNSSDLQFAKSASGHEKPELVFMFPGQGAQYVHMGKELYDSEEVFRQNFDQCASILKPLMKGEDLSQVVFGEKNEAATEKLKNTYYTQPAIFAIEYSLAQLWISWGIKPDAMLGHSIGEFVAACIAGVFSLEDALTIVSKRAALMQKMPEGSMLSVRTAEKEIAEFLDNDVCLAAVNAPGLTVLSGPHNKIAIVKEQLEKREISASLLQTSHAFHSSMMDAILDEFGEEVGKISLNKPRTPFVSTVSGKWIADSTAMDHAYWTNHLRVTVRFGDAIQTLLEENTRFFLEVGPGRTLATLSRQQADIEQKNRIASSFTRNEDQKGERSEVLWALGRLILQGIEPDWKAYFGDLPYKTNLPTYPFLQQKHWLEPPVETVETIESKHVVSDARVDQTTEKKDKTEIKDTDVPALLAAYIVDILEESSGIEIESSETQASFIELGLDSLFLTQIALTLQKTFGLRISFRQLNEELNSIKKLVDYIHEHADRESIDQLLGTDQGGDESGSGGASIEESIQALKDTASSQQQLQAIEQLQQLIQQMDSSPKTKVQSKQLKTEESRQKPFGAVARIQTKEEDDLSDKQKAFIRELTLSYNERTRKSKEFTQKNRKNLADPRVVTGFKPQIKELIYQIVVNKSKGCHMWDLDGNEYIDVLSGFGSNMFGNSPDFINEEIKKQVDLGYEIGPQHPLAGEVTDLICELTGFERAALCNTGSEAVLGAIRMARTVSGNSTIVMFNGSYHGINDEVIARGNKKFKSFPAAPGIPKEAVENTLILDYGTEESFKIIEERIDEIAAILVEPVQSRRPDFRPVEFLKKLRKLTLEKDTALIFDEVITGFRMHQGGTQAMFGIKADIATYGKVIGGGMSIGAMVGISKYMDALDGGHWQYGDQSIPEVGVTYFAGTFVRHPLTLAAAKASLEFLKKNEGRVQEDLNNKTAKMCRELNQYFAMSRYPLKVVSFGSLFKIIYTQETNYGELLFILLRNKGIHIWDGFPCFITIAHTEEDIKTVIEKIKQSADELSENAFYEELESDAFDFSGIDGARLGRDPDGNPAWFIPDPEREGKYLQVFDH